MALICKILTVIISKNYIIYLQHMYRFAFREKLEKMRHESRATQQMMLFDVAM